MSPRGNTTPIRSRLSSSSMQELPYSDLDLFNMGYHPTYGERHHRRDSASRRKSCQQSRNHWTFLVSRLQQGIHGLLFPPCQVPRECQSLEMVRLLLEQLFSKLEVHLPRYLPACHSCSAKSGIR